MLGGLGRAENANEDAGGEIDGDGDLHDDTENVSKKKKVSFQKCFDDLILKHHHLTKNYFTNFRHASQKSLNQT